MADDVNEVSEGEVSPAKKKGGFPLILIIIIAVVMGAGGFFAGKMLSGGGKKTEPEKKVEKKAEEKKAEETKTEDGGTAEKNAEEGDKGGKVDADKPGLLALDPFTVNLKDPFGRRYAEVVLSLEVSKKTYVLKIKNDELLMPKIRDEIFMIISSKSYNELNSTSGKISLKEEIMMRVNEIMNERLGIEPITNVYFTKFLIQ